MKILYCASAASHIDNFHTPYISAYKKLGYRVDVCSSGEPKYSEIDKCINLPFIKKKLSLKNLITVLKLSRIIRKEKYDVIFTQASLAGLLGRLAAILSFTRVRAVHICHGYLFNDDGSFKARLMLLPEKLLAKRTERLIVMNGDDFEIAKKYKLAREIHCIDGMGLITDWFPPISAEKRSNIRESLGIAQSDTIFVNIGEFSERKNQSMIIKAFSELKSQSSWLVLIGFGETLNGCRELSERLGIADRVIFAYQSCSVNDFLRISDVFVTASIFEGLPFCVEEALFCGIPVVASEIKGHKDLINESNGILFPLGDIKALAGAMESAKTRAFGKPITLDEKYAAAAVAKNMELFGF